MTTERIAPAGVAPDAAIEPPPPVETGGWTYRRREVIDAAGGVCTRCGAPGADTAIRGWFDCDLVAVHTRCVLGLSPLPTDVAL